MNRLYVHNFRTDLGTIRTAATDRGLALVALPGEPKKDFDSRIERYFSGYEIKTGGSVNLKAEKQLKRFLEGRLKRFDLKLDVQGTEFQKKALRRVARIPYGKTLTYGELAAAVGSPGAARAVGSANARNPLPLVIPCHRVVATNGLGGYGGGPGMKKKLLKMEGAL